MSKKEFLEDYASNPELARKTLKQGGLKWQEIKDMGWDVAYAANTGAVPGMIRYSETVKFAKRNHLQILQALQEFENEYGILSNKPEPTNETKYFNWLAWFAWEHTMNEVLDYFESKKLSYEYTKF